MDWLRVTVRCEAADLDDICAALVRAGAEEQEILGDWDSIAAELDQARRYWDYVDQDEVLSRTDGVGVRVYVTDDEAGRTKRAAIESAVVERFVGAVIETELVREEDWANTWREFYHPFPIGERLMIVPDWEEADTGDRVAIRMEPGLVFGTGEHQSTQLCLAAIERHIQNGASVLDLGCGSGILSIGALLLGADKALAVDIDPNALGTARENARRNAIADERISVRIGDVLTSTPLQTEIGAQRYDLILANIVADVIIALAPHVAHWLRPGGTFICSGIISERLDDVLTALQGVSLRVCATEHKDDWVALEATR